MADSNTNTAPTCATCGHLGDVDHLGWCNRCESDAHTYFECAGPCTHEDHDARRVARGRVWWGEAGCWICRDCGALYADGVIDVVVAALAAGVSWTEAMDRAEAQRRAA